MHEDMRVSRVRIDVEGRSLSDCESALNLAYSVIFKAVARALEAFPAETSPEIAPALIFPRTTEFVEDQYGSAIRREDGAIFYTGRRVISFEADLSMSELPEGLLGVVQQAPLFSDDDRIARLEMDASVQRVGVLRKENGVWAVTVVRESGGIGEHEGASLAKALDSAEASVGLLAPSFSLIGLPHGTTVTATMPVTLATSTEFDYGDGRRMRFDVLGFPTTVWIDPTASLAAAAQVACQNVGVVLPAVRILDARGEQVKNPAQVVISAHSYAEPFQVERP